MAAAFARCSELVAHHVAAGLLERAVERRLEEILILELGLTLPDAELRYDDAAGEWRYGEPDWQELRTVVTGHGPKSQDRLEFRRVNRAETAWVRDALLGAPKAAA